MSRPVVRQSKIGNILIKMFHFWEPNDHEPEISYKHDYALLVAKGKVRVTINATDNEFIAPHIVYVKAGISYKISAVTDNVVVYGVYGLRDTQGSLLELDMVPSGASELDEVISRLKSFKQG